MHKSAKAGAKSTARTSELTAVTVTLAIATLVIRFPSFGDPTYHLDEAFYLFVGEQMRGGLVPYVDVWDRKPAGIFVFYAAMSMFGGVLAYQAFAALAAWLTAVLVGLVARTFASAAAACASGMLYLAMLGTLAGGGGQSPVFYNVLIAAAAWLVLGRTIGGREAFARRAAEVAMLLCGVALTFKPTVLPEGMFFGLVLLALERRDGASAFALLRFAARLCMIAVIPTALIWLYFAASGHFADYWFATVQSVFLTVPADGDATQKRVVWLARMLWLPLCLALGGLALACSRATGERSGSRLVTAFVAGWLIAATLGFLMVPNFYDHYALPLAVVLAVASARLFQIKPAGLLLAALAIFHTLALSGFPLTQSYRKQAAQAGFARAADIIERNRDGGCLFVFDATPALYRAGPPCRGTRFMFPEHLSNAREAPAIGANPSGELAAVLAHRPAIIAMARQPSLATPNLATRRLLLAHLARDYRPIGTARLVDVVGEQSIAIYAPRRAAGRWSSQPISASGFSRTLAQ